MSEIIGKITIDVIKLLKLKLTQETPIFIGDSNKNHMKNTHPYEYNRFYSDLPIIISTADYVRLNTQDNSIEYVKSYGKYIKLAVRVAGDGNYYARSLYFIESDRVENLVKKGELKPLTGTEM